jgi:hypothetical protein
MASRPPGPIAGQLDPHDVPADGELLFLTGEGRKTGGPITEQLDLREVDADAKSLLESLARA